MAASCCSLSSFITMCHRLKALPPGTTIIPRFFHLTNSLCKSWSGKYKPTRDTSRPLTYEQSNPPEYIAHRKSWNSWNTSTLEGGRRQSETAVEDLFIRKMLTGTFFKNIGSEIIIKRQHNMIRIAFIAYDFLNVTEKCFLIGYTEELLGYWLQCPVKLELQFISDPKLVIHKYI